MGPSWCSAALLLFLLAAAGRSQTGTGVVFRDVAAKAGLDLVTYCGSLEKNHIQEASGTGGAFLDYDGDGYLDLYIVNAWRIVDRKVVQKGSNALYRNLGDGTFADVTGQAGVGDRGWGAGVCVGDFDNDGNPDLYVTNVGPNRLYRNKGDGTFADVTEAAGVGNPGMGTGAAFLDHDGDGDLDLYVANYVVSTMEEVLAAERTRMWRGVGNVLVGPRGLQGDADAFYRNNGDGTFTDVTASAGLSPRVPFYGFGVCATDYDGDGDPDIYVANDTNPNFLYRNNGDGTFREAGGWMNAARSKGGMAQAGMGVDAGDFDNDGDFDLFVTNFSQDYSTLYQNQGPYFEDITPKAGLWKPTYVSLSWGTAFFDYDNDGALDLFIANGHIYSQLDGVEGHAETYRQPNQLFRNQGGRFVDVSDKAGPGMALVQSSRGAVFGDYDNDGDVDVAVINIDDRPNLLRNDGGNAGHWLQVKTVGTRSNRMGIGARVRVRSDSLVQVREVRSGSSYLSQNDTRAHFGLGERTRVDTVEVRWPSGMVDRLVDVAADRLIVVQEGGGR